MEVLEKWPVGTREEKLEDFLNILWDIVHDQHIAYACKVLAKDDVKEGKMDTESMKSIFAKWLVLVVVYNDLVLYLYIFIGELQLLPRRRVVGFK